MRPRYLHLTCTRDDAADRAPVSMATRFRERVMVQAFQGGGQGTVSVEYRIQVETFLKMTTGSARES